MKKNTYFNFLGIFLFFFSILFLFKIATYDASDIDTFLSANRAKLILLKEKKAQYSYVDKVLNVANFNKLYFLDNIVQCFGLVSLFFPFLLFCFSLLIILQKKINYFALRVFSSLLFISVNSFLLGSLYFLNYFFEFLPGGYIGYFLSKQVNRFLHPSVSILIAIFLNLVLFYLIFLIKLEKDSQKATEEKRVESIEERAIQNKSFFSTFFTIRIFFELIFKIFTFFIGSFFDKKADKDKKAKKIPNKKQTIGQISDLTDAAKSPERFVLQEYSDYKRPPLGLIAYYSSKIKKDSDLVVREKIEKLTQTLKDFGVKGQVVNWSQGPVVTLYEFLPEAGIRASRIIGLTDDIARVMMVDAVRIFLITGKDAIGIEISNETRSFVGFRELLEKDSFIRTELKIPMILGVDIFGKEIIADLSRMPHLLIAGTTGSGKSVGINCMILSLIFKLPPSECRFIMIDPKMLEFSVYNNIPHLLMPVITDSERAIVALKWAVKEMEERYAKMSQAGVRNIDGYNEVIGKENKMPYLLIFIDEMADLMIIAGKEFEVLIQRLAQMARASGIHIVTATQRPSVDVLTGVIKANFPTRISYYITSKIDSRTIIGEQGAERLLGKGDMLYVPNGGKMIRVHGPFVSDSEINAICKYLRENHKTNYIDFESVVLSLKSQEVKDENSGGESNSKGDYEKAVEIVLAERKTSISYIQRRLRIGYNKAASFIEQMEEEGILSPADHTGKRRILSEEG